MNPHGTPIWYELVTPDADAAQRFYGAVAGWRVVPGDMPGLDYRILSAPDGDQVGAFLPGGPEAMGPTKWRAYVAVDDVDAAVAATVAAGGSVQMPATDLPDVGRIAMLGDPQGASFYVMRGTSDEPSRAFVAVDDAVPGHMVWNELAAPDPDAAIGFYAGLFGWRQQGAMPMGDLGEYKFLVHGDTAIGAAMGVVAGAKPGWQFYVHAADIDAATEQVRAGGGTVIQGPDQIPGGSWSVVAEDPQGARFGLVGPRQG